MTTTIHSNGSKWAGEQPDGVEELLTVLDEYVLDRVFEGYGDFILRDDGCPVRFWGNFLNLSHVFSIDTDEPELITKLTAAIHKNRQRPDYLEQPSPEEREAAKLAYDAAQNAKRQADRVAKARAVLAEIGE